MVNPVTLRTAETLKCFGCSEVFRVNSLAVLSLVELTLKVTIMTAADDSLKYFFIVFQRK